MAKSRKREKKVSKTAKGRNAALAKAGKRSKATARGTSPAATAARDLWRAGDWPELQRRAAKGVTEHADDVDLLLLSAASAFREQEASACQDLLARAAELGASGQERSRLLLSGLRDSLGAACCAAGEQSAARAHFEAALRLLEPDGVARLDVFKRHMREAARLGLLADAAGMIEADLDAAAEQRAEDDPKVRTLQSELELLRHELSIALRRGQIGTRPEPQPEREDAHAIETDEVRRRATSQLGQELWVLERTGYKRGGFFVEFGATDGVLLSNTYMLETDFAWDGICAEPNPAFLPQLRANRRCRISEACISDRTGKRVEFIFADAYGGFTQHAESDQHADKREAYRRQGATAELTTISLHDFLLSEGAPRRIDYLSIDTEGSEYEILAAFPFDEWDIRLITVEHNFTEQRQQIFDLLSRHGYARTEADWDDWYEKA